MPLAPYIPPTSRIRDSRAAVTVLEANSSSQTDETGVQVTGSREIHQEGEHDLAQHWGFSSRPAQGTELVEILDQYGSRVAVAERIPCPVALADGEACLWISSTTYVKLAAAGNALIYANGDITARAKAATGIVHLGRGGTEREVAYAGDKVTEASDVACASPLNQHTVNEVADLTVLRNTELAIITALNLIITWANAAAVPPVPPVVSVSAPAALTTTAMAVSTNHSYVSSGSGTTKVDDA